MLRHTPKLLLVILFVSVLLRMTVAVALGDQVAELPGTADQVTYHTLANRVIDGYGFTFDQDWWPATRAGSQTAHWSFFYTFYLALNYLLFGIHPLAARIIQALITGFIHPLLAYWMGSRVFSKQVGLAAAACTCLYAYFIYYSSTLMTEPFYITVVMAFLYLSIRFVEWASQKNENQTNNRGFYGVGLGILIGIAILLRQSVLLFLPFLFAWILWAAYRKSSLKRVIPGLMLTGLVVVFMILPFTIFNYIRYNHFVLLNTNAGYAFYMANNSFYGTQFQGILTIEQYQSMIPAALRGLDEAALDSALLRLGMQYIFENPGTFILLSLSRIPVYFQFWPSPDSGLISNLSRVASFGLFWPFMMGGLAVAFIRRGRTLSENIASPVFLLLIFTVIYSGIHLVSWSLIRYRLPVDAVLLLFAGLAITELGRLRIWSGLRLHKA